MTVTYSYSVANATMCGFGKLLFRWKGSIYKLMYREMLIFIGLYTMLSMIYRYILDEYQKRIFEKIALYCHNYTDLIPLSFVFGFYVALIVGRWWQQYNAIPWPDTLFVKVSAYVTGDDERGLTIRRTLMRYINLMLVLTLQGTSISVKKRFSTLDRLVEAGLMTKEDLRMMDSIPNRHGKWWYPSIWFATLAVRARKENRIRDDYFLDRILVDLEDFRGKCGLLFAYDWISVPLVYTQVVTLALYTFFLATLMGRQYLDPTQDYPGRDVDLYIPLFTILQFFFYMGWLKVAEQLINPFGEDDDDYEMNWMIDRNFQASYMACDAMHNKLPKLQKDYYWGDVEFDIPYTKQTAKKKGVPFMGSTVALDVPAQEMDFVPLETIMEADVDEEDSTMGHRGGESSTHEDDESNERRRTRSSLTAPLIRSYNDANSTNKRRQKFDSKDDKLLLQNLDVLKKIDIFKDLEKIKMVADIITAPLRKISSPAEDIEVGNGEPDSNDHDESHGNANTPSHHDFLSKKLPKSFIGARNSYVKKPSSNSCFFGSIKSLRPPTNPFGSVFHLPSFLSANSSSKPLKTTRPIPGRLVTTENSNHDSTIQSNLSFARHNSMYPNISKQSYPPHRASLQNQQQLRRGTTGATPAAAPCNLLAIQSGLSPSPPTSGIENHRQLKSFLQHNQMNPRRHKLSSTNNNNSKPYKLELHEEFQKPKPLSSQTDHQMQIKKSFQLKSLIIKNHSSDEAEEDLELDYTVRQARKQQKRLDETIKQMEEAAEKAAASRQGLEKHYAENLHDKGNTKQTSAPIKIPKQIVSSKAKMDAAALNKKKGLSSQTKKLNSEINRTQADKSTLLSDATLRNCSNLSSSLPQTVESILGGLDEIKFLPAPPKTSFDACGLIDSKNKLPAINKLPFKGLIISSGGGLKASSAVTAGVGTTGKIPPVDSDSTAVVPIGTEPDNLSLADDEDDDLRMEDEQTEDDDDDGVEVAEEDEEDDEEEVGAVSFSLGKNHCRRSDGRINRRYVRNSYDSRTEGGYNSKQIVSSGTSLRRETENSSLVTSLFDDEQEIEDDQEEEDGIGDDVNCDSYSNFASIGVNESRHHRYPSSFLSQQMLVGSCPPDYHFDNFPRNYTDTNLLNHPLKEATIEKSNNKTMAGQLLPETDSTIHSVIDFNLEDVEDIPPGEKEQSEGQASDENLYYGDTNQDTITAAPPTSIDGFYQDKVKEEGEQKLIDLFVAVSQPDHINLDDLADKKRINSIFHSSLPLSNVKKRGASFIVNPKTDLKSYIQAKSFVDLNDCKSTYSHTPPLRDIPLNLRETKLSTKYASSQVYFSKSNFEFNEPSMIPVVMPSSIISPKSSEIGKLSLINTESHVENAPEYLYRRNSSPSKFIHRVDQSRVNDPFLLDFSVAHSSPVTQSSTPLETESQGDWWEEKENPDLYLIKDVYVVDNRPPVSNVVKPSFVTSIRNTRNKFSNMRMRKRNILHSSTTAQLKVTNLDNVASTPAKKHWKMRHVFPGQPRSKDFVVCPVLQEKVPPPSQDLPQQQSYHLLVSSNCNIPSENLPLLGNIESSSEFVKSEPDWLPHSSSQKLLMPQETFKLAKFNDFLIKRAKQKTSVNDGVGMLTSRLFRRHRHSSYNDYDLLKNSKSLHTYIKKMSSPAVPTQQTDISTLVLSDNQYIFGSSLLEFNQLHQSNVSNLDISTTDDIKLKDTLACAPSTLIGSCSSHLFPDDNRLLPRASVPPSLEVSSKSGFDSIATTTLVLPFPENSKIITTPSPILKPSTCTTLQAIPEEEKPLSFQSLPIANDSNSTNIELDSNLPEPIYHAYGSESYVLSDLLGRGSENLQTEDSFSQVLSASNTNYPKTPIEDHLEELTCRKNWSFEEYLGSRDTTSSIELGRRDTTSSIEPLIKPQLIGEEEEQQLAQTPPDKNEALNP